MRMMMLVVVVTIGLGACSGESPPPPQIGPWAMSREAVGHFCSMTVADHSGPKGQILIGAGAEPVWFSSVRDAVAYTRLPEKPRNIRAFYVNDMAVAGWDSPEPGTWIEAAEAWFVIDSSKHGGMGAAETVPFSSREAAQRFVEQYGGRILRLDAIPTDYVLGGVSTAGQDPQRPPSL